MHRRQFLDPMQLVQTAGSVAAALELIGKEEVPDEIALLHFARRAMGTQFEIVLPAGTPHAAEASSDALDLIDQLEGQLTVYRESSEVSRLNRLAASAPVPVEPGLFELLALCKQLHEASEGAFDVAVGALIKAWGFFKRQGRVPEEAERAEALAQCGSVHLRLDAERRTVQFDHRGLEINFGSIGKGYALDRAGETLRAWGVASALFHGGFSSVLAIGSPPNDARGWLVGINHPDQPERRIAQIHLRDQALGTSAATYQNLLHEGKKLGHLLDPRTGWPAKGMASASAIAPTAALADALATIFFIQGVDWTRRYCVNHPEVGAVLQEEGAATPVLVGTLAVSRA